MTTNSPNLLLRLPLLLHDRLVVPALQSRCGVQVEHGHCLVPVPGLFSVSVPVPVPSPVPGIFPVPDLVSVSDPSS